MELCLNREIEILMKRIIRDICKNNKDFKNKKDCCNSQDIGMI